jgi:hypothetical protein
MLPSSCSKMISALPNLPNAALKSGFLSLE